MVEEMVRDAYVHVATAKLRARLSERLPKPVKR